MTTSIPIPKRGTNIAAGTPPSASSRFQDPSARSLESSPRSSGSSPSSNSDDGAPADGGRSGAPYTAKEKGKTPVREGNMGVSFGHERRTSLLSSSISKSEHTVVNIGDEDAPRLITFVKASQGFDWNLDMFLPSYASDHDYTADLERRQDPVQDIIVTDQEVEDMFPR